MKRKKLSIIALILFGFFSFAQTNKEVVDLKSKSFQLQENDSLTVLKEIEGCFSRELEEISFVKKSDLVLVTQSHSKGIVEKMTVSFSFFNDTIMPQILRLNLKHVDCGSTTSTTYFLSLNNKVVTVRDKNWVLKSKEDFGEDCYVENCLDKTILTKLYETINMKSSAKSVNIRLEKSK